MKEYIFGERNGIYIIDLQKTLRMFKEATRFVADLAAQGGAILFVGTKRQAQEAILEESKRCEMYLRQPAMAGRPAHQFRHHPEIHSSGCVSWTKCPRTAAMNCFQRKRLLGWSGNERVWRRICRDQEHEAASAGHLRD